MLHVHRFKLTQHAASKASEQGDRSRVNFDFELALSAVECNAAHAIEVHQFLAEFSYVIFATEAENILKRT